jgi:tetratricopeptide (TPR) repeat protein
MGFLYYQLGDRRASIESLQRALEIAPNDAYANAWLARNHALLSRNAKSNASR